MKALPGIPLLACAFAITLSSCARRMFFDRSWVVPRATARIIVKHRGDNRYLVTLKMRRVMPPENLKPPMHAYIVWMETAQNGTKRLGEIKVSAEDRRDVLDAVTPFRPRKIFITAEASSDAEAPIGQVVLTTR